MTQPQTQEDIEKMDLEQLLTMLQQETPEMEEEEEKPLVMSVDKIQSLVVDWVQNNKEEVLKFISDNAEIYSRMISEKNNWQLDAQHDIPCGTTCTFIFPAYETNDRIRSVCVHMALDEENQSIRFAEIIPDHPLALWRKKYTLCIVDQKMNNEELKQDFKIFSDDWMLYFEKWAKDD